MGWLGRGFGELGAQLGEGHDIALGWKQREQDMALRAAQEKIRNLLLPLQIQEIQQRLKQMGHPQSAGVIATPGGGQAGLTYDPNTGKYSQQPLTTGIDKNTAKQQIASMAAQSKSPEVQATLKAYSDSIDAGEDPQQALQKALAFMGISATHAQVGGRLVKGDIVPMQGSVTGYGRLMFDANGNYVRTIPNVVMPGLMPKETEGWEKSTTADGDEIMVPKTTITKVAPPGAQRSAGGAPPPPQKPGEPPSNLPPGTRFTGGHKDTAIQRDAVVASKTAREAAILRDDVEKNAAAAKAGNAKASLALVFAAVRTMVMGAGRMTNVEIEQELKAGSYEQRLERWYQSATEGTLPTDQIDQIREIVGNGYEAKRKGGEEAWSYAYPDKPLPPWLRGQAQPQAAPPPPPGFVPDKKAQGPH